MKSIKELADELGYSKTHISQTEERKQFANKTQTENNDLFAFFKDQLKEKDRQLSKKDEQIFELNERLRETIIMLNDSRKELSQTKQNLVEFESQKNKKWWKFWS